MDVSVKAVDDEIVPNSKKFVLEERENERSVIQNFIVTFSDTVYEGHGPNRGKAGIGLSTGEVPVPTATGNYILFAIDILLGSYGKIRMQYVISDPDPDTGDGR